MKDKNIPIVQCIKWFNIFTTNFSFSGKTYFPLSMTCPSISVNQFHFLLFVLFSGYSVAEKLPFATEKDDAPPPLSVD